MTFRILVALEGSPSSEAVLSEVERMTLGGADVHFLHVVPMLPLSVDATSAEVMSGHDQALSYLAELRERLPDVRGLDLIRTGDPADAILHAARQLKIDLIALGAHFRAGVANGVQGSVAETVLRRSHLPVLLSRPGGIPAPKAFRRILVPLDGSEDSLTILPTLKNITIRTAAEVVFLHVSERALATLPQSRTLADPGASEVPEGKLQGLADRLRSSGLEFRQMVAQGDSVEEILTHAETLDADLIAMSLPAHKDRERTVVGRAASTVLERLERTVLLQRPAARGLAPEGWKWY